MSDLAIRERVAREVFEFSRIGRLYASYGYSARDKLLSVDELPAYETDIAAAWLVVEEMRKRGYALVLEYWYAEKADTDDKAAVVRFLAPSGVADLGAAHVADEVPLAICLAALAALEAK